MHVGFTEDKDMTEILQTLAIAIIPSAVTAFISYKASEKNANIQIQAIKEQNKADIEKLMEQHKVNLEAEKAKHQHEIELKEQEYNHQIEMMKMQHQNEMKREENSMINQLTAQTLGGLMGGVFGEGSPLSNIINQAIEQGINEIQDK